MAKPLHSHDYGPTVLHSWTLPRLRSFVTSPTNGLALSQISSTPATSMKCLYFRTTAF